MKSQTYVILSIIFVILISMFAIVNTDPVKVNYLIASGELPLILVILFSVLMGGVITALVGVVKVFQLQRQLKTLKLEKKQLQEKLQSFDSKEENENVKSTEIDETQQ